MGSSLAQVLLNPALSAGGWQQLTPCPSPVLHLPVIVPHSGRAVRVEREGRWLSSLKSLSSHYPFRGGTVRQSSLHPLRCYLAVVPAGLGYVGGCFVAYVHGYVSH